MDKAQAGKDWGRGGARESGGEEMETAIPEQ